MASQAARSSSTRCRIRSRSRMLERFNANMSYGSADIADRNSPMPISFGYSILLSCTALQTIRELWRSDASSPSGSKATVDAGALVLACTRRGLEDMPSVHPSIKVDYRPSEGMSHRNPNFFKGGGPDVTQYRGPMGSHGFGKVDRGDKEPILSDVQKQSSPFISGKKWVVEITSPV